MHEEVFMKLLVPILVLAMALLSLAQNSQKPAVPRYNPAAEGVYKGTVAEVRDRQCPVSGGVGTHMIMKLETGTTIEVHLATTEFTKMLEMNLQKGDPIEVTGWKTEFQGVQTIFAREVKYGNDTYVFRAKDGLPAWTY
jgi:DNA/RNA endonuclease YhcR with UshA esterase domain